MTSMTDALLKAGVISQEKIAQERQKEFEKKQSEEKKRREENEAKRKESAQKQKELNECNEKFDALRRNPEKKGFLLHLIHAFLPNDPKNNVQYGWDWSKDGRLKKCALCSREIISITDALELHKKGLSEFFESREQKRLNDSDAIQTRLRELGVSDSEKEVDDVLKEFFEAPLKFFGDKKLAVFSESSTKTLCAPCYKDLQAWIVYRCLMFDGEINRIIQKHINNPFLKSLKRNGM